MPSTMENVTVITSDKAKDKVLEFLKRVENVSIQKETEINRTVNKLFKFHSVCVYVHVYICGYVHMCEGAHRSRGIGSLAVGVASGYVPPNTEAEI